MPDRTKADWIRFVEISLEYVSGTASIPLDIWEKLGLTVSEIIGQNSWEYLKGTLCIVFRKRGAKTPIQFGDELPEKRKPSKCGTEYVWRSMFPEE